LTLAVVYALAVDHSLTSREGTAPLAALSRQLPRLAVQLLNSEQDRGLRFFPFISREGEDRQFFVINDVLPVSSLMRMHGQDPSPRFVIDGCIHADGLRLRIIECQGERVRFDEYLEFDVADPLPAVSRLMFEFTGLMGWTGALPSLPDLERGALVSYLVARDNLLSLEAELESGRDARVISNALDALEGAPHEQEVRDVALEIWSRQAAQAAAGDGVRSAVAAKVAHGCWAVNVAGLDAEPLSEFLTQAAAVLEACDQPALALAQYERAAALCPEKVDAVCRAATMQFDAGRFSAARELLRRTLDLGERDPTVIAQLAVIEENLGHMDSHAELVEELMESPRLQPPMLRVVVSYLLAQHRADEAVSIASDFIEREPGAAGPWFDKGRALVATERYEEAIAAFEGCLCREPAEALRNEAERHLRFARSPELLAEMQGVDDALVDGQLRTALRRARRLVRHYAEIAEAWLFLGVTLLRLHRRGRAERALRRSLELEPGLGEAHNRLGILLVGRGNHREGYEELREAVRLQPREPSAYIHLAQACHYLGMHEEARKALERAERLGGPADAVEAVRRQFY